MPQSLGAKTEKNNPMRTQRTSGCRLNGPELLQLGHLRYLLKNKHAKELIMRLDYQHFSGFHFET
jgi:hypothetical protein